ncbi:MAG: Hsp20/alpha crystallin family protein [Desulfobacterales bacterium]
MAIIRLRQPAYPGVGFSGGRPGQEYNMFENEMNRLFQKIFGRDLTSLPAGAFPPVNVYQDEKNIYLTAELPGMQSSDIELKVDADGIEIRGERKIESEGESSCYYRREREGGTFSRKLSFKTRVDTENVSAGLKNGVLNITMPKSKEAEPKKIAVKAE